MMKACPHCGASLPEEASFCPICAQAVNRRFEVKPPRHMPRRALYSALLILVVAVLAVAGWLYSRPKVYDNGTAEVIYTDSDGTYQLLAGFGTDRFQPVHEDIKECEEGLEYRMPSRLYINHQASGVNAKEVFLKKTASVTVDILQPEDTPEPWRWSEPAAVSFAPDAALISLLDFTARSGPMELIWTITMKNGDTIRLHQRVELRPIAARHYYPEDAPMGTAAELQALVDRIGAEVGEDTVVYLHLPPVTYEGGLVMGKRPINLLGSEGEDGKRTTFTGAVRAAAQGWIYSFDGIDFVGGGDGVGVSVSARVHLTDCRVAGWRTGVLCYGDSWVNLQDCVLEDNTIGFHFNAANATPTTWHYSGNLFRRNGTAVLLERVSSDQALSFDGTRFSGNGTDIDNRCDQALDLSEAIFE